VPRLRKTNQTRLTLGTRLADQGRAPAQFFYAILLYQSDGVAAAKSVAAHSYKLSANHGALLLWTFVPFSLILVMELHTTNH
jgi:hypothetical protein